MEDVALSQRLKRLGLSSLPAWRERVVTSGRRWETQGPWRTVFPHVAATLRLRAGRRSRQARPRLPMTPAAAAFLTLVVFAKEPVPGHVKTRLAAAIGEAARR